METTKKIQLQLTIEDINKVLQALGKVSYETVYTLIAAIHTQANEQLTIKQEVLDDTTRVQ